MFLAPVTRAALGAISTDDILTGAKLWMNPGQIPGKLSSASMGTLIGIAVPVVLLLSVLGRRR